MIRDLPCWVGGIEGLIELDLSHNVMRELPDNLQQMLESLKLIDLSHNQLRVLPDCLVSAHAQHQLIIRFEGNPGERAIGAQLATPAE